MLNKKNIIECNSKRMMHFILTLLFAILFLLPTMLLADGGKKPQIPYPYSTDFEKPLRSDDDDDHEHPKDKDKHDKKDDDDHKKHKDKQDDEKDEDPEYENHLWETKGFWRITKDHNAWTSHSGQWHLDNNRKEKKFKGKKKEHRAELKRYITIPADSVGPVLFFWHKLTLNHPNDEMLVEIRIKGEHGEEDKDDKEWQTLKRYTQLDNQTTYTQMIFSLDAYKGKAIRIRFVQRVGKQGGVPLWVIDDLYIGGDIDGDGIPDAIDLDRDGDGISNDYEIQVGTDPDDPTSVPPDLDGDGIPDSLDDDRDGDGVPNATDLFPDDPTEWADLDGDGIGDNADPDRDGDGISNDYETQLGTDPNDPASIPPDLDGDGIPDSLDNDRDGDGVPNDADVFPNDPTESFDLDGDGIGDNADPDRDGDGISNDYEIQTGFDPNDPSSTPPDLDADGIPDSLDPDRDGDGIANDQDTYPEDATRNKLAAVNGLSAAIQGTSVNIQWNPLADTVNTSGYHVYRLLFGATIPEKLTATPVTTASYLDTSVANGTGYTYQIFAVDQNAKQGDGSVTISVFMAYNVTAITNLQAARISIDGQITWDTVTGMRYQLYRALAGNTPQPVSQLNQSSFLDTNAVWNQAYHYSVATITDFTNVFTNLPISVTGPASNIVELPAVVNLGITIEDAVMAVDGIAEVVVNNQTSIAVAGEIKTPIGAIDIVGTNTSETLTTVMSDGRWRLVLPVNANTTWTITATEQNIVPSRQATFQLRLIADTAAPVVTIDGAAQRSIDAEQITLTGAISDTNSAINLISVLSDRFPDTPFGVILGANNSFFVEVPLQIGSNNISVFAVDAAGNKGQAAVVVDRTVTLAPSIFISSPLLGSESLTDSINVDGVVYTTQAPENVKISIDTRQQFAVASATPGVYPFTFPNVALTSGVNAITVNVDTPAGNTSALTTVTYDTSGGTNIPDAPVINITNPNLSRVFSEAVLLVTGTVDSVTGIAGLTVNGSPVTYVTSSNKHINFQHDVDLSGITSGPMAINVTATDLDAIVTTVTFNIIRDIDEPVITITTPGMQAEPGVNRVIEIPFIIDGSVTEANLASLTINGQPIALTPDALADTYLFSSALQLPVGIETPVVFAARDQAGNSTTQTLIFNADIAAAIEIITPAEGQELTVVGPNTALDIVARISGLTGTETITVAIDGGIDQPMVIDGVVATALVSIPVVDGSHEFLVKVVNDLGNTVSQKRSRFTLIDADNIPLEIVRTEPENAQQGVEPNKFIALYFNRPIDPALLQISVKETAHGLTYDLSGQQATNPIMEGNKANLIEVHRDQQPVTGGIGLFPGNTMVAYYPVGDFAYNGDVFVDVTYNNVELTRFTFKVRTLPTFLQGFAIDQLMQAIIGLDVSIPKFNRHTVTDREGSFSFGFGDSAENKIPGGRYRLVFNADRKNPAFGELETWANFEEGRLTSMGMTTIPFINKDISFQNIQGGQNPVILAGGDLVMDLSQASLTFKDGRDKGDVHVQFMPREQISFRSAPAVGSQWLFAIQPTGTAVTGSVGMIITMPQLYGSYDYVPFDDIPVLIVGFNSDTKQIIPIGVGTVQNRKVIANNVQNMTHLDYIGYAIQDHAEQALILRYMNNEISFDSLVSQINQLAAQ